MPQDVWTPMITSNLSIRNKSLRARNKVARVDLLRGLCRYMLWLWPVGTDNAGHKKIFCPPKKKQSSKQKNVTTTFGKPLFLTQYWMRYVIYIPPNTKDLTINLAMIAYGNRQNETTFARASNSDLLRALKHLMETRLNKQYFLCYQNGFFFLLQKQRQAATNRSGHSY